MKRNGFTLIELLAVIVITGLIIAITTPKVLEILETSKRETFKLDVAGVVRNLDNQIYNLEIKGENYQGVYTVENGIIKEVNNFNYSIDKTYNGTITITEDKEIGVALHNDRFCATKRINDPDYTVSNYTGGDCIPTTPESCFEFDSETGTILDYYLDEGYYDEPSTATTLCDFDVAIPKQIGGVNVEIIRHNAFADNNLTSLIIPNSVTSIGDDAFIFNDLESVTIPNSVMSIGWGAFSVNNLTSIIIPNSVTSIGGCAFHDNNLTNIIIPSTVTNIEEEAFSDNNLTNVIIPNSVTKIGSGAFETNYLTSITIPNSVTIIEPFAFSDNNLSNIIISTSVTSIGEYAFNDNNLTSLTIPNSVNNIEEGAFRYNNLTSVTILNNIDYIGRNVFSKNDFSNSGLTSILYNGTTPQDWNNIINGTNGTPFITGTVTNQAGNVIISAN